MQNAKCRMQSAFVQVVPWMYHIVRYFSTHSCGGRSFSLMSRQSHPIAQRFQLALLGDFDMGVVTQIKDLDNTPKE
ncbi:MAG: hypothetical protein IJC78_08295, partial [Clostridia bacterium]|nr:hypothetical protein [Clostridia bacterium]